MLKPVVWLADTLAALRGFPREVQDEIGYGLYLAQIGDKSFLARPLKGLGTGVLEIRSAYRGNTYRGVYAVRFAGGVYVLHVFQKKSKRGSETPQAEIELVRQRLRRAGELEQGQGR